MTIWTEFFWLYKLPRNETWLPFMALLHKLLPHTLTHVWQQLEYRIDVCPVTRGAHIEHL
jgi:hypothetical protein